MEKLKNGWMICQMTNDELRMKWKNERMEECKNWKIEEWNVKWQMMNCEWNERMEELKNWRMKYKMINDVLVSSFFSLSIYGNKYEEYVFC